MLPRHSSGVRETHLTISCSKYRTTSFQVSRGLHSNPRPILAATGARDLESAENFGGPLVQYIDLIVDVTVCGNTKYEPSRQYRRRKKLLRKTSGTVRPVSLAMEPGFSTTPLFQLFMKCDNCVSPFKHDPCVPGRCHGKLLAFLIMESARKVYNERLRCAEVFSQAEYSTTLLSIGYVGPERICT